MTEKLLKISGLQRGISIAMAKRIPKSPNQAEKAALIGGRILLKREQKGYTQAQLALKINRTAGAIGQYETGRNLPTYQVLERLAEVLDVTTEWLMTGNDLDETLRAHTTAEREVLKLIRAIKADKHDVAIAMLRALAIPIAKEK